MKEITVGISSYADFRESLKARLQDIDAGSAVVPRKSIYFEAVNDFLAVLTPKRVELLLQLKSQATMKELAERLGRDHAAITRDVDALVALGLLEEEMVNNPGHGRRRVISPAAPKILLIAEI